MPGSFWAFDIFKDAQKEPGTLCAMLVQMLSFTAFFQACLYCESHFEIENGEVFCARCTVEWRRKKLITVYDNGFICRSLVVWGQNSNSVGQMVKRLKQASNKTDSSRFYFMAHKYWTQFYAHENFSCDDLVFIPAPARDAKDEDHASLFAKELTRLFGARTQKLLRRISQAEQKGKSREERAMNRLVLRDDADLADCRDRRTKIVFIDDLLVSGQTARAAYEALGKPKNFEAWTIAYRPLFLAAPIAKTHGS